MRAFGHARQQRSNAGTHLLLSELVGFGSGQNQVVIDESISGPAVHRAAIRGGGT